MDFKIMFTIQCKELESALKTFITEFEMNPSLIKIMLEDLRASVYLTNDIKFPTCLPENTERYQKYFNELIQSLKSFEEKYKYTFYWIINTYLRAYLNGNRDFYRTEHVIIQTQTEIQAYLQPSDSPLFEEVIKSSPYFEDL